MCSRDAMPSAGPSPASLCVSSPVSVSPVPSPHLQACLLHLPACLRVSRPVSCVSRLVSASPGCLRVSNPVSASPGQSPRLQSCLPVRLRVSRTRLRVFKSIVHPRQRECIGQRPAAPGDHPSPRSLCFVRLRPGVWSL